MTQKATGPVLKPGATSGSFLSLDYQPQLGWWVLPYLLPRFLKRHLCASLLQVDPAYTGRVGASEAALFLKKSGLSDIILGTVWQD